MKAQAMGDSVPLIEERNSVHREHVAQTDKQIRQSVQYMHHSSSSMHP